MNIKFINYNGIKGYARVMYNDVKDADKYKIEVAYNGKDIKDLLEYLFKLESKIDKAIEYINNQCTQLEDYGDYEINSEVKQELLDILKEDNNENK